MTMGSPASTVLSTCSVPSGSTARLDTHARHRKRLRRLAAVAALVTLAGCAVAPPAPGPVWSMPAQWRAAPQVEGWVRTQDAQQLANQPWWTLFDDPELDALAWRAQSFNAQIETALAAVGQADALLRQQRAQAWPTLGAQLSSQRSGGSERNTLETASLGLAASWMPDVWGRVRLSVYGQQAALQASQADLAGMRLAVAGTVASTYFAIRAADAERTLLREVIEAYERSAQITRNRYDSGIAARTDTLQAEVTLRNARANLVAMDRARALLEHALALLVGEAAPTFSLPPAPWSASVPPVPVDVPAALLLRRPDLASAERAVATSNAQIGVARTAWFPDLNLNVTAGAAAARLADLVASPASVWSLGLNIAQALFDAGSRDARLAQTLALRDAAVARYRQASLSAMREVQDQLATLATLDEQLEHARASARAAGDIERQMLNRYQSGLSAYTEVVTVQASALAARRTVIQLQLARQQAVVSLILALGGGWQAPWAEDLALVE